MLDLEIFKIAEITLKAIGKKPGRNHIFQILYQSLKSPVNMLHCRTARDVSVLYRFRYIDTCLAYVTACDLDQSFNLITTLKIIANIRFLSRVSTLTRDTDIAILSVRLSARQVPVLNENGCHFTVQ